MQKDNLSLFIRKRRNYEGPVVFLPAQEHEAVPCFTIDLLLRGLLSSDLSVTNLLHDKPEDLTASEQTKSAVGDYKIEETLFDQELQNPESQEAGHEKQH